MFKAEPTIPSGHRRNPSSLNNEECKAGSMHFESILFDKGVAINGLAPDLKFIGQENLEIGRYSDRSRASETDMNSHAISNRIDIESKQR